MDIVIIAAVIGVSAGILSGILGIGGGVIMIPALIYFFSYSQHQAQGTTLAAMVLPIGFLAAFEYYKHGHVNIKVAVIIAVTFFVGGFIGAKFAVHINEYWLKKSFAVLMLVIAIKMLIK